MPFVETLLSARLKVFRSDGGGEFVNHTLRFFFDSRGVFHQKSCPHTPEHSGVAERKHRHIVEMTLALISKSAVPLKFWNYAFAASLFLINRLPSLTLGSISPFEKLFACKPDYGHLRVFGCACYPLQRPYNSHKLQPRSTQCVFLGYPLEYKGYICYDIANDKFFVSRHVIFDETVFPFAQVTPSDSSIGGPTVNISPLSQALLFDTLAGSLVSGCRTSDRGPSAVVDIVPQVATTGTTVPSSIIDSSVTNVVPETAAVVPETPVSTSVVPIQVEAVVVPHQATTSQPCSVVAAPPVSNP